MGNISRDTCYKIKYCMVHEYISACYIDFFSYQPINVINRLLLDSLVVECWHQVREVPGSIPSQGLRYTKDVIKMVPVVV